MVPPAPGHQPPALEDPGPRAARMADLRRGRRADVLDVPLRTPLTTQQLTAYNVLLPAVRAAEGLAGGDMYGRYQEAACPLHKQVEAEAPVVVLAAAKQIKLWTVKAMEAWRREKGAAKGTKLMDPPLWEGLMASREPMPMVGYDGACGGHTPLLSSSSHFLSLGVSADGGDASFATSSRPARTQTDRRGGRSRSSSARSAPYQR